MSKPILAYTQTSRHTCRNTHLTVVPRSLPPYGPLLAERLKFKNPPLHAVVCVGLDSWTRAEKWNKAPDGPMAMVLPPDTQPESLQWPVSDLPVVIDASAGPSDEQLAHLATVLIQSGSGPITQVSLSRSHNFMRYSGSQPS